MVHSASTSAPKQEAVTRSDTETEDESGLNEEGIDSIKDSKRVYLTQLVVIENKK